MPVTPENELTETDELLYRQVHPDWVQGDRPSSCAFRPTPKDNAQLSVDYGAVTTAQESFESYVDRFGPEKSQGVWGVTVGEVATQSLKSYSDPAPDSPCHSLVDFAPATKSQWDKIGTRLRSLAHKRGMQFGEFDSTADDAAA